MVCMYSRGVPRRSLGLCCLPVDDSNVAKLSCLCSGLRGSGWLCATCLEHTQVLYLRKHYHVYAKSTATCSNPSPTVLWCDECRTVCEIFDAESDASELIMRENLHGGLHDSSDPSCGIFALLAECLGRNIQLASFDNEMGLKARRTNEAVLHLLSHRHTFSSSFQEFCRTPDFLEPLAQALCLVHDEKLQRLQKAQEESLPLNARSSWQRNEPKPVDVRQCSSKRATIVLIF